ncbi:MAG: sugar kinase [Williamsia sp.]|nr:sugar kinase [Williamsia sp.]
MKKVFCFGEFMLRFSPLLQREWIRHAAIPVYIAGAELNVASGLVKWKVPTKYCTAVPDNYMSREIMQELESKGLDISAVIYSGDRLGIYYLPQGGDLKSEGVIYDRAHSSFSQLVPGTINWDAMLEGVSWFHFSAITPALTEITAAVCKEAVQAAAAKGITVSVDLNHRARLWKWGKDPVDVVPELAQYCDVIMGNIWAANTLLGIPVDEQIHSKNTKQAYLQHAETTSLAIQKQFPKCRTVANTFRFSRAESGLQYYAALHTGGKLYHSAEYSSAKVLNQIGTGDCFMAGLIYGLYNGHAPQEVIDFAAAAAFGKMNEPGDATDQTVEDVRTIIATYE